MILLNEIAQKLQNILNGIDTEILDLGFSNPTDYEFNVQTEGYHLDKLVNQKTGKNFIPVFLGTMGGQYNPVPNLKQATYTLPIVLYFPVRFKNDFFALNDYLVDCFVGRKLDYGTNTGKCISNISVAQYGEIQSLDVKEFANWVANTYQKQIDTTQPYMSMNLTLYLTTANSEFVFGNDANISLTFTIDETTYTDNNVVFNESSVQSASDPSGQQLLGQSESAGLPINTSYSSGFSVYYKDNSFYNKLVQEWFNGNIQTIIFTLSLKVGNNTFTRNCYVQSCNLIVSKGNLITLTFAFGKRVE